jgi:hypothetical protein
MDKLELIFVLILVIIGIYYIYLASGTQMLGEDEAGYVRMAREFSQLTYPEIEPDSSQNSFSPFISLIISFFMWVFNTADVLALGKAIIAFFGILTLFVVYLIGKRENTVAGICSAMLLFMIPFFTNSMFLLYLEIPIAFFSALSLYLFLKMGSIKSAIFLGLILGISNYVKSDGIFLAIGVFSIVIIKYFWKKDKSSMKLMLISIITASIIIFPLFVRNVILYNYPYIEGFNSLFSLLGIKIKTIIPTPKWISEVTKTITPTVDYSFYIGWGSIFLTIVGATWAYYSKNKTLLLSISLILLFFALYFIRGITLVSIIEPRHLSIIYPFFPIIGGVYLGAVFNEAKVSKKFKWLVLVIIVIIIVFSIWTSFNTAISTHDSVRYSSAFMEAVKWIDKNTPKDSVIFTALGGPLVYYGRLTFWNKMEEFPDVMTTQNATFIKDTLLKYNVTHILVYSGIVANNYIVPGSNFLGLFTYNFVNVANKNQNIFIPVFSNQETIVYQINKTA